MDTKSVVGAELVKERTDSVATTSATAITRPGYTANGKGNRVQHNVMTPQPYNRLYQLTGTKVFANKYPVAGYALDAAQLAASGVQPR